MNPLIQLVSNEDSILHESLLIEGLNCVEVIDDPEKVKDPSVLIMDQEIICKKWEAALNSLLNSGKTIIFPHPGKDLEACFNIEKRGSLDKGYLINKKLEGFKKERLQIFDVVLYRDGESLADLEGMHGKLKGIYPSISKKKVGRGTLLFYSFNLPQTIFRLTHGRDIYFSESEAGVMRTDMGIVCEEDKFHIPQVDILRRMLVRLIEDHCPFPLPRLWYFPSSCLSGLCITHDSDNASRKDIETINKIDTENKIPATTFMSFFNGSVSSWRRFKGADLDLQYHHVHLYFYHPKGTIKKIQRWIGDFSLFQKMQYYFFSLQKFFFEILSSQKIKGIRNHGLVWNTHSDQPVWFEKKKSNSTALLDRIINGVTHLEQDFLFFLENPRLSRGGMSWSFQCI